VSAAKATLPSSWVRILLITTGSSMRAMIRRAPPQAGLVSMSMPKDALDPLRPSHRYPTFRWRFLFPLLSGFGVGALSPFRRCHRRVGARRIGVS
jgi:hypothetical protein